MKVGRSFHTDDQVVENIVAMVEGIQEHVIGKISGIKVFFSFFFLYFLFCFMVFDRFSGFFLVPFPQF